MYKQRFQIVVAVLCWCFWGVAHASNTAEDNYRAGLSLYLKSDYLGAQREWINAARDNHALSMFNLGLLNEQGKVPNSDVDRAQKWFELAGRAGYVPALYHQAAKRVSLDSRDMVGRKLMLEAAEAGYAPATEALNSMESNSMESNSMESNSMESNSMESNSMESAPLRSTTQPPKVDVTASGDIHAYQTESFILAQDEEYWTIQVLAYNDQARVEDFIDEHGLAEQGAYYRETQSGKTLYKLLYGFYPNKQAAAVARQAMPEKITAYGPWLRPVRSIQSVILKQ